MTSVFQAYSGFVANFQKKAILSHVGQYFRCLNLAMGSLRERLIINNTEMDEKLRELLADYDLLFRLALDRLRTDDPQPVVP